MRKNLPVLWGILFILLSFACSGGSSTSSSNDTDTVDENVTALEIAEQMSLVTAQESGVSGALSQLLRFAVPTSGDYVTDEASVYVFDESMQVLDIINEILCYVDQTQYTDFLNEGNYIALVDESLCSQRQDRSSDSNNQSSGQSQEFVQWTVNASRASNNDPEIVQFWFNTGEDPGSDGFNEIRAQITITEGRSSENPFGIFSMDFAGYFDGTRVMTGNLSSLENEDGNVEFEMVMNGDAFEQQTHAILSTDGTSGRAYALRSFQGGSTAGGGEGGGSDNEEFTQEVDVSFDSNNYYTDFGDRTRCLDRTNFEENVWEYNLYDSEGSRVSLNSGFGIRYGERGWGWAGYYGIWLPPEVTVTNGLEVIKADDDTPYTVFQGGGRLIRRTRNTLTLGDFIGDVFTKWDSESQTSIQVQWNGTNLVKIGEQVCGENGCTFTETEEETLDFEPNEWVGLWKQGLGQIDLVVPEDGVISNEQEVPYYQEEFVSPSDPLFADGSVTFKCYYSCLTAPLTSQVLDSGNVFETDIFDPQDDPYLYTFDPETYTLSQDDQAITIEEGTTSTGPYSWGVRSGAMVLESDTLENPWEIWQQEVTYNWETGPNPWNKLTTLLDGDGNAVEFDQPLSCLYQDDEEGTFFLDYQGDGKLFGIPYEQITSEDENFSRWVAAFTIPDGSELNCGGTSYYTKAISVEQRMTALDASECADLNIESVGAPDNEFTDPELGEAPTVTNPPSVIGGVLQ